MNAAITVWSLLVPTLPSGLAVALRLDAVASPSWNVLRCDSGVAAYPIYRNGMPTLASSDTINFEEGLVQGTHYTYLLSVFDDVVNKSTQSNSANAKSPDRLLVAKWQCGPDLWRGLGGKGGFEIPKNALTISNWIKSEESELDDVRFLSKASGSTALDCLWMLGSTFESEREMCKRLETAIGSIFGLVGKRSHSLGDWTQALGSCYGGTMRFYGNGVHARSIPRTGAIVQNPAISVIVVRNVEGERTGSRGIGESRIFKTGANRKRIKRSYYGARSRPFQFR